MSDGLNKLFMNQKSNFLRENVLSVMGMRPEAIQPAHNDHVCNFDLQHRTTPTGARVVELMPYAHRTKTVTWKSNHVTGYWLRWRSEATVEMVLDSAADYFFTSELGGCQVVAAALGNGQVRVGHIAGNKGRAFRTAEAQRFPALRRQLSSSHAYGTNPAYQPDNSDVAWANVIGFREKPAFGTQRWTLWYQIVENHGEGLLRISGVGQLYP